MAKQTYNQIEGAFPALDRKKLGKPFVMDGKNYLVDLDGPRSAFGYQCPYDLFTPHQFMQSFAIGSEIFYFARDVGETITQISTVSWPSRQVIPALKLTTDATRPKLNLPWSHAYIGTYHYFANRTAGVLRYDAINRIWEDITLTLGINNVFFVTESAGRLICLAEGISSWSAIDDGTDNVPSLTTGAGFQAMSLIGSLESDDDYLGLQKTARGYLTFTRKGVLRSEIIDSLNPFRHLPGESKQVPLTAWNVTKISDTEVVILSRHGLFKTEDGFFKEWQPIMGEYFKDTEIRALQSQINGFISIYYSRARDEFYVSFAQAEGISQYTKSWVLYVKADNWGNFNRVFKGLVFIDPEADGIDFKQAYVDNKGHLCYLDDSVVSLRMEAQSVHGIYVQPLLEYDTYKLDATWLMPTNVRMAGFSAVPYPAIAGWYEELGEQECYKTEEIGTEKVVSGGPVYLMPTAVTVNGKICVLGAVTQEQTQIAVDSFIEVGLFRLTDEEANDQLSLITNVAISCLDELDSSVGSFDDWLEDYAADIIEDWLAITPDVYEDWGLELASGSTYTQKIRGSLDGYKTFEDQFVDIDEVLIDGKTKFCSCANAGLFQAVEISALNVGESYHVKTLELNGNLLGRL